jgi:prophage regulatory protein
MKFYTLKEVMEIFQVSKSTIYKWVKEGKFPEQVKLGGSQTRWTEEVLLEYVSCLNSKQRFFELQRRNSPASVTSL